MYEKIKDMIERNDFHTAEKMIEKHHITLTDYEKKDLVHIMKKTKKVLKAETKKCKPNGFTNFMRKYDRVVFYISLFFFGCCIVCSILGVGPRHSTFTPFRFFFLRLSGLFSGIGFVFLGISDIRPKRHISKFIVWGVLILVFWLLFTLLKSRSFY